jgi:hypothetical protein
MYPALFTMVFGWLIKSFVIDPWKHLEDKEGQSIKYIFIQLYAIISFVLYEIYMLPEIELKMYFSS